MKILTKHIQCAVTIRGLFPICSFFLNPVIFFQGPLGIRMAKKAIDQGMQAAGMPSALAVEGECYEQLLHTEDRLEGLAAFAERRKPVYSGK